MSDAACAQYGTNCPPPPPSLPFTGSDFFAPSLIAGIILVIAGVSLRRKFAR